MIRGAVDGQARYIRLQELAAEIRPLQIGLPIRRPAVNDHRLVFVKGSRHGLGVEMLVHGVASAGVG
jgi:hypothetical protein